MTKEILTTNGTERALRPLEKARTALTPAQNRESIARHRESLRIAMLENDNDMLGGDSTSLNHEIDY